MVSRAVADSSIPPPPSSYLSFANACSDQIHDTLLLETVLRIANLTKYCETNRKEFHSVQSLSQTMQNKPCTFAVFSENIALKVHQIQYLSHWQSSKSTAIPLILGSEFGIMVVNCKKNHS